MFAAVTRLLTLPNGPAGTVLLDRLGFSESGRYAYSWQSEPAQDTNMNVVVPTNFPASDLTGFLRTDVLVALQLSESNLARITDTNYTLLVTAAETTTVGVTIDYGDLLLLRALLRFGEYLIYTVNSWNLDTQLTDFRDLATLDDVTMENFLEAHTNFFTFATTNDLLAARSAFVDSIDLYSAASEFIRARPVNTVRLFTYDFDMADTEEHFRELAQNLMDSLTEPVVLVTDTNYTVYLRQHFAGQMPPRSMLPKFTRDRITAGSLPDPTFGGIMGGLARSTVEAFMSRFLDVGAHLMIERMPAQNEVVLTFHTVTGRVYAVEFSSDLAQWTEASRFIAEADTYMFTNSLTSPDAIQFCRLVDLTEFPSLAGRVLDLCTGQPITGASVVCSLDGQTATSDSSGNYFVQTRVQPGWIPIELTVSAVDYETAVVTAYLYGNYRQQLDLFLTPSSASLQPPNDDFANPILLTGGAPSASGTLCGATTEQGEPLGVSKSVWWSWMAPYSGQVTISTWESGFAYPGYVQPSIAVYRGNALGSLTSAGYGGCGYAQFDAVQGETYQLKIGDACGNVGAFQFQMFSRPSVSLTSPAEGTEYRAPADITITGTFAGVSSPVEQVELSANGDSIGLVTTSPFSFVWSNVPPGYYWLEAETEDALGYWANDYRSVIVRPQNDNFADRIMITGTNLVVAGDNSMATAESGEPGFGNWGPLESVWWKWTAPASGPVSISVNGEFGWDYALGIYTGNSLPALSLVASNLSGYFITGSLATFDAIAGVEYSIAIDGWSSGPLQLRLIMKRTAIPQVSLTSPTNEEQFVIGTPVTIAVTVDDPEHSLVAVDFLDFYDNGYSQLGASASEPYSVTYVPGEGWHSIYVFAVTTEGVAAVTGFIDFEVVPPPAANDRFANRITLEGSEVIAQGHNFSASTEPNEPDHGCSSGGASVWWTWTAPSDGWYTFAATTTVLQWLSRSVLGRHT